MQDQQTPATTDDQAIEGVEAPPAERENVSLESIVGDPEPVEPVLDAPATPAVEQPGPDGGAPGTGEDDLDDVPLPEQREDGKWTFGKYVADTPQELVRQVERGRRHAEHLVGKRAEESRNPFEQSDEFDEGEDFDEEPYTEAELAATFGKEIAQGLIEAGVVSQPQQQDGYSEADLQAAYTQVLTYADQVIGHPEATGEHFRAALQSLVTVAPQDVGTRQRLLSAWGDVDPVAAAQEAAEIRYAELQVAQEFAQHQQYQHAQQVAQAEQETVDVEADAAHAFVEAQHAFSERNPDWQAHDPAMKEWMSANLPLLRRAKGDRAAVYSVFQAAYDYAQAKAAITPPAGEAGGVSEHGAVMGNVREPGAQTDPRAAASMRIAEQRDLAGLETGAAVDDVTVNLRNPNPAGLAETPIGDLLGMKTVR